MTSQCFLYGLYKGGRVWVVYNFPRPIYRIVSKVYNRVYIAHWGDSYGMVFQITIERKIWLVYSEVKKRHTLNEYWPIKTNVIDLWHRLRHRVGAHTC